MEIRTTSTYRFYTTAPITNRLRDKRHKRGLFSIDTIDTGTQVRVEVLTPFEDGEPLGNHTVKNYFIGNTIIREDKMLAHLQAQDSGVNEAPKSLDDLAARCYSSGEWFAYKVLERLIERGAITLAKCEAAWLDCSGDD